MQLNEEFISGLEVSKDGIISKIAGILFIKPSQAAAVIELSEEGCTVPFISRYRKERTGELDEVQVREVVSHNQSLNNLESRRIEVIKGIFGQGKLSEELFANINKCNTLTEIEDIYAPYKRKKKTRGMLALEKGLEPLAEIITKSSNKDVLDAAPGFVNENAENPELSVASAEDAIKGAMDIIAERVSQDPDNRAAVKKLYMMSGSLLVKGVGEEEKKEKSTYKMYWDYKEALASLKPHRVLAVNRGEKEGELEVSLELDEEAAVRQLQGRYTVFNDYHASAIEDSLYRLVSPAVQREIRSNVSEDADFHGISVFSENLKNLLLSAPIKGTRVLGVDPGIRTGTKCAAVDETGKFLGYFVVYQEQKPLAAKEAIIKAIKDYDIQLVAVGNGTASHEMQKIVSEALAEIGSDTKYAVVDEDGASVYSASDIAREEFPELDLTIRGAISIGRRIQDPLAELVKVDPKSMGVGLYQHDVNQKRLSETLDEVVESVVNRVGVNLNTASHSLLKYVSGINSALAKKIVKYRDENGQISNREQLKKISGMGEKSFEQCAGFLKIPESKNPLDNSWVHPENYALASEILEKVKAGTDPDRGQSLLLKEKYGVGDSTIADIVAELKKPNRDPRDDYPKPILQQGILAFEDLKEGMKVTGKVKNVVDFGAFVDIGIKESALIHISEISDSYVKDSMDALKLGDVKEFRIISLDHLRRRIGLSLKQQKPAGDNKPGQNSEKPAKGQSFDKNPAKPASRQPATRGQSFNNRGQSYDKDNDGSSYNPFAELLKRK
ncbi:Tex family protein [Spirochaetota bacterium]